MKKIQLRTTELDMKPFTGEDRKVPFPYKDAILNSLRTSIPETGLSFVDMEMRLKIIDKVEKAEEFLILEDKQHSYLVDCVRGEKWKILDAEILNYVKAIENAEEA